MKTKYSYEQIMETAREANKAMSQNVLNCYSVEDGFDGYCVHAFDCPLVGMSWVGPGSQCITKRHIITEVPA